MTRDAAHREAILAALSDCWEQHPDLRLGQLVAVFAGQSLAPGHSGIIGDSQAMTLLFYIEDGDLAHGLSLWSAGATYRKEEHAREREQGHV